MMTGTCYALNIQNMNDLLDEEKKCIIACRTNNPSLNSFAAEIIFHARATIGSYPGMKWDQYDILPYDELYMRAVKADLALDDENHIFVPFYKDYNGIFVKEQRLLFGEK